MCSTIPEPERKSNRGRPPISLQDAIFAAIYKVYSGFSSRRFTTDLTDAEADGHIDDSPHFNVVLRTLGNEKTTEILTQLIQRSSLPLKAIETDFAVDSSGFGSNRFVKWFDVKHGSEKRKADWVKVHICTGVKTNVVTAVRIGDEGDAMHIKPLLKTTAESFSIGEVSADKAYLSREILEYVESLDGKPYIPFKSNSVPDKNGKTWEKLYHQFALNRDEFCQHYHKRSNVESTFSMVKRKFGDAVRAKTDNAMKNEVLAKFVAHNVVVCIHEMFALGIEPSFGPKVERKQEETEDDPWTVKFPGA